MRIKESILLIFTLYIGIYLWFFLVTGDALNLPDWIAVLFTLVFQYFFRKSNGSKEVK